MDNLSAIGNFFKKIYNYIFIFVLIIFLIFAVLSFIQSFTKKDYSGLEKISPILADPIALQKSTPTINFKNLAGTQLANEAQVYKVTDLPATQDYKNLAQAFGFTKEPITNQEGKIGWVEGSYALSFDPKSNFLQYQLIQATKKRGLISKLSREALLEKAKKELVRFGLYNSEDELVLLRELPLRKIGMDVGVPPTESDADFFDFYFSHKLDESEFLTEGLFLAPTKVSINWQGEILGITHYLLPKLEAFETYPLKNLKEIQEAVKEAKYTTVSLVEKNEQEIFQMHDPYRLGSVSITKISLVYFRERLFGDYLKPAFLLEGETKVDGEKEAYVTLLIDGVKDELLSP
ncbi:MAG: hypothetical protein A2Y57_00310 [Candidatus Woykebacteria bacterium RBG_13_40_7b]|uniref:Uncharacterized protein n=1 Tax=Candidatus Woykebacteria bacterium RBG_13_40_7b TaxID=1802594 RepID=A0A1G1WAM9_9BACT|nr:MAG: hypothetical protein A2Y57_00310 [Candidatus Woykebacteria bacterium RBG_13_40_7b]